MLNSIIRTQKDFLYYEKNVETFSNICAGVLIRSIGEGLRIAYVDCQNKSTKLTNFIENLSLSHSFAKKLRSFNMDIYTLKSKSAISKTIIPLVEFCNISDEIFWGSFRNYNIVIFDNLDFENLSKIKLISLLNSKNTNMQIVCTTSSKKIFDEMKSYFNENILCNHKVNKTLATKKGIINIMGKASGKSLYALGYLVRSFLYKNNVKLIYFDKGDDIYGDAIFFSALKKWSFENRLYGTLDFVKTGIRRFSGSLYRQENTSQDTREAQDALMLLKTSLQKQTPVIADELNSVIERKILSVDEVLPVLKSVKNQVLITGETSAKEILDVCEIVIEFKKD